MFKWQMCEGTEDERAMGRGWKELEGLPRKSLDCSKWSVRVMLARD